MEIIAKNKVARYYCWGV